MRWFAVNCFDGNHTRVYPDVDKNSSQLGNQPLIVINLQLFEIECDLPPIKMCLVAQI